MNPSAQQRLDQLKQTIWQTRPDLQVLFQDNQDAFETWLLTAGTHEYLGVAELLLECPTYIWQHLLLNAESSEASETANPNYNLWEYATK